MLFGIIASIIFCSCKENIVDPPEKVAAVYGKITDQNDNILSGVNVHYIFSLSQDVELRNVGIAYTITTNQTITMVIYNMNNNEVARPVNQASRFPGNHTQFFDGNNLTNGLYRYKISGESFYEEGIFLLLTNDINKLIATSPLSVSGSNGEFAINYSTLGIGKKWQIQGIEGEKVIADSVKFVFSKEGYQTLVVPSKLDTAKKYEKTFKMIGNN